MDIYSGDRPLEASWFFTRLRQQTCEDGPIFPFRPSSSLGRVNLLIPASFVGSGLRPPKRLRPVAAGLPSAASAFRLPPSAPSPYNSHRTGFHPFGRYHLEQVSACRQMANRNLYLPGFRFQLHDGAALGGEQGQFFQAIDW